MAVEAAVAVLDAVGRWGWSCPAVVAAAWPVAASRHNGHYIAHGEDGGHVYECTPRTGG